MGGGVATKGGGLGGTPTIATKGGGLGETVGYPFKVVATDVSVHNAIALFSTTGRSSLEKTEPALLLLLTLLLAALGAALLLLGATVRAAGLAVGLAVRLAVSLAVTTGVGAGHLYTRGIEKSCQGHGWGWLGLTTMSTAPLRILLLDTERPNSGAIRILLLDTETNGLPQNRFAPPSQWQSYPAILQLSWAVFVVEGCTMRSESNRDIGLALHPSIPWNTGAAAIHGLSEAEARRGTPAAEAFTELAAALRTVDVVVAHNLSFDKPVIRAAAYAEADRGGKEVAALRSIWPVGLGEFCTMRELRNVIRIPSPSPEAREPFKVPKLGEVYTWLFGHAYDISGGVMHTSRSDTHCLSVCLAALIRKGIVSAQGRRLVITTVSGGDASV